MRSSPRPNAQPSLFRTSEDASGCRAGVDGKALARVVQRWLVDDTAPENLEPFSTEKDLDLEAWRGPRKGCLDPSYSERVLRRRTDTVTKEGQDEAVERQLQVFSDELRVSRVVCGLARVGGREMRHVFDDDVGALEVCLQRCVVVLYFLHAARVGRHDARALGLMEDGIVGAVDLVAAVDVGGEEPPGDAFRKDLDLVGGGVGAKHEVAVDVVAVRGGAAGMVLGEGEEVKVLVGGDERGEGGEMGVGGEVGLDECAEGAEGVGGLGVQPEGELGEDRRGHVRQLVRGVLPSEHAHRRRPERLTQRDREAHE